MITASRIFCLSASALLASSAFAAEATTASGPTDPQIAAIVVASNNVDINAGQYAKAHTKNAEVKEFAADMIKDHASVNQKATALVKKLDVKPEPNDTSKTMLNEGKGKLSEMKKLSGADFDKAYVANEVAYHEQVLSALDTTLIPSAKNADLKKLLEKARSTVAEHLEHAKRLNTEMNKQM